MSFEDYKGVYVFVQQVESKIDNVSFELLGKAKELANNMGTEVTAVLLGSKVSGLYDELSKWGADKILVVDDPALEPYTTEPYAYCMDSIIRKYKPAVVLYGATAIGRDLAPRVAARVGTGLTADCTKLEVDAETKDLRMTRCSGQYYGDHSLPGASAADGDCSSRRNGESKTAGRFQSTGGSC